MNKAIFWDFDGTLVYCHSLWSNSVLQVLNEQLPDRGITLADVRPYMASGYPWDLPEPHPEIKADAWWLFMYRKFAEVYRHFGVEPAAAESLGPYTRELILDVSKYHLYDDTIETLNCVQTLGYQNYILSNNYPELRQTMRALGLEGYFSGCVISGEIGLDKPDRAIFEYALTLAGHPEHCLMVGDNPRADIAGASNAGIPSVLVHRDTVSNASYTCAVLAEIPSILATSSK